MKILFLTHRVPFPQNGGYAIVVYNTVKGLVDLGHHVALISLNTKKNRAEEYDELIDRIKYKVFDIDISVSVFEVAVNLLSKTSFNIDKYYDAGFEKMLVEELRNESYDIIQFDGFFVTLYLAAVQKNTRAKLLYRAHNIEHLVWLRLSEQKSDPFKKSYLRMHAKRIRNFELQQLNKFQAITVFTPQDKAALLGYGTEIPVEISPVAIDLDRYKPDFTKTEFPSLFFLGSLDWLPNREGIEWFLNTFFNDLTEGDLRVRFYVAGTNIPEEFDDYEAMGKIFIQGEVDDGLEFVNSKSIMIVPLLSGGGMRVKIVEGMAMQKCIISTSLGAEGIDYQAGFNILIAENREQFYDVIKYCISDEDYCRKIGAAARQLVEEQHDMLKITHKLVAFYQACLK